MIKITDIGTPVSVTALSRHVLMYSITRVKKKIPTRSKRKDRTAADGCRIVIALINV